MLEEARDIELLKGLLFQSPNIRAFNRSLEKSTQEFELQDFLDLATFLDRVRIEDLNCRNVDVIRLKLEHRQISQELDNLNGDSEDDQAELIEKLNEVNREVEKVYKDEVIDFLIHEKIAGNIDEQFLLDHVNDRNLSPDLKTLMLQALDRTGKLANDHNSLLLAICLGNLDLFNKILDDNPELVDRFYSEERGYPLNIVADQFHNHSSSIAVLEEMLRRLLSLGKETGQDSPESSKGRALNILANEGALVMIDLLISGKCSAETLDLILNSGFEYDLSQRDEYGRTALRAACTKYRESYLKLINMLLDHGANAWDIITINQEREISVIESLVRRHEDGTIDIDDSVMYQTLPLIFRHKHFDFPEGFDEERKRTILAALEYCVEFPLTTSYTDTEGNRLEKVRNVTMQGLLKEFEYDPNFPNKSPHPELIRCLIAHAKNVDDIIDIEHELLISDCLSTDWTDFSDFADRTSKTLAKLQNLTGNAVQDCKIGLDAEGLAYYNEMLAVEHDLMTTLHGKINASTRQLILSREIGFDGSVDESLQDIKDAKNAYLSQLDATCEAIIAAKKLDMENRGQIWLLDGAEIKEDGFGYFRSKLLEEKARLVEPLNELMLELEKFAEETKAMERQIPLSTATPLSEAVYACDVRSVEFLLKEGSNPNILIASDIGTESILHRLCRFIKERSEYLRSPECRNSAGEKEFLSREIKITNLLVEHGADIDDRTYLTHLDQQKREIQQILETDRPYHNHVGGGEVLYGPAQYSEKYLEHISKALIDLEKRKEEHKSPGELAGVHILPALQDRIDQQEDIIAQKDVEISEQKTVITQKDVEIAKLRAQLASSQVKVNKGQTPIRPSTAPASSSKPENLSNSSKACLVQ